MDKVDIICVCNYHGRGGAQNNAARLASGFRRRGYSSCLVFLFEREEDVEFKEHPDLVIIAKKKPTGLITSCAFFKNFFLQIRNKRPDVVIGFFPMSNVVSALFSKRARVIGTLRNPAFIEVFDENGGRVIKNSQSRVGALLDKVIGATSLYSSIVAVSCAVKESFKSYPAKYNRKICVIHNATPRLPQICEDRIAARRSLGLPDSKNIIGMLGRLHEQKNVAFMIDVLARIHEAEIVLALAGDGPQRDMLEKKVVALGISDRVIFLGMLTGEDVTRFYRAIDIFAFPSIFEGFGLSQIEAMSQGCPVIASEIPVMAEVGAEGSIRLAFDADLWVEMIYKLIRDDEFRKKMIANGIARSDFFHDEERMIDEYLKVAGLPAFKGEVK